MRNSTCILQQPGQDVADKRMAVGGVLDTQSVIKTSGAILTSFILTAWDALPAPLAFARDSARGRQAAAAGDLPAAAAALSAGRAVGRPRCRQAALRLWRGSALAGLDGPHVPALAQALHEAQLAVGEDHARVLLALGRPGQAAGALAGLAAGHQLREGLCQLLMLARYQGGDLPGALAAYHCTRQALASELGTDPGPALSGLLRRDPGLDPPAAHGP